jgi:hypothetical protein
MRLVLLLATIGLSPASALAQRSASIVAGVQARPNTLPSTGVSPRSAEARAAGAGHAVGMANGALIGAGLGIAVGLVTAPILNAQNGDHSEDAYTYIVVPAFGAFLGLIIGGIVGWRRGG